MEQEYAFHNDDETRRLTRAGDVLVLAIHLHDTTGGEKETRLDCRQCREKAKRYIELESKGLMIW